MANQKTIPALLLMAFMGTAAAQYEGWRHSGSLYIVTTPDGADLPAESVEKDFPLLVRLHKDWFDFSQVQGKGDDLRYSAAGKPLAYQIEAWDPVAGTASVWLRIPEIRGNTQQEIRMHWGKPGAVSESSGAAVFNKSNGYVSVLHLGDPPAEDAVGVLTPTDMATTSVAGMIGQGRHFEPGQAIKGGDGITSFPSEANPHTTEAWFRTELSATPLIGWGGAGNANSSVPVGISNPRQVTAIAWHSSSFVVGTTMMPKSEWSHVAYTYQKGDTRIYLNGKLDGVSTRGGHPTLAVTSPAEMWIGGWQKNFKFAGDIDEVRVSKVFRSADWIKLGYANQNPLQSLVGSLVRPGDTLAVSPAAIQMVEGEQTVATAQAGGARKVFWILKQNGAETIVSTDRFSYTLDPGRVAGDTSVVLQLKAVYGDGVKTKDIPVTIKDTIPEPAFTLQAPATWNGRDPIEVVPSISNLAAMKAKGVGEFTCHWTVSGGAVAKEVKTDRLVLRRSQFSGPITVRAAINNGGADTVVTVPIMVTEPKIDPWIARTPAADEKPEDNQFYARDDKNEGSLYCNGKLAADADSVFLNLFADGKLIKTESQKPGADKSYAFAVKLKAGLIQYKVELGSKVGSAATVLHKADNLVCGDAYIIQGQSNAVAYNYENTKSHPLISGTSPWIRSYGGNGEAGNPTAGGWGNAAVVKTTGPDRAYFIGAWGMAMARTLVQEHKIPICILNGARGGTQICEHLPDPADRLNTTNKEHSIYRNLLQRVVAAKLTHGIRGVLWHQGEADQGTLGPTGDYNYKVYQKNFVDLSAAWKEDFPNLRNYYIYQIWPHACTDPSANDMLREVQRTLPRLYSHMRVMGTLGVVPGSGCHYGLDGYQFMADLMSPLVRQDIYGWDPNGVYSAPDLKSARFTSNARNEIALEFGQDVAWNEGSKELFYLDGVAGKVVSGSASGKVIKLQLAEASTPRTITYLVGEKKWVQGNLIYGKNGIAALTFCEVPLSTTKP